MPLRSSQTTPSEPSAPFRVNVDGVGSESGFRAESVLKWAGDVNNRDVATLTRKCWTWPESYIRQRYLGTGDRLAQAMT